MRPIKDLSPGTFGNAMAGMLGGGIGRHIIGMLWTVVTGNHLETGVFDIGVFSILQSIAGGGIGGSTLQVILGAVKIALGK